MVKISPITKHSITNSKVNKNNEINKHSTCNNRLSNRCSNNKLSINKLKTNNNKIKLNRNNKSFNANLSLPLKLNNIINLTIISTNNTNNIYRTKLIEFINNNFHNIHTLTPTIIIIITMG